MQRDLCGSQPGAQIARERVQMRRTILAAVALLAEASCT
eukprot:COSAG06_NODE_45984_length_350_cov_1.215139_1_plen_38_part_01